MANWTKLEPGTWPDDGERILVGYKDGADGQFEVEAGKFCIESKKSWTIYMDSGSFRSEAYAVTYWQPLPEMPEAMR